MAKKKFIIIILSVLLFLSATVLGVSSVYRVDEITVYAPVISKEAEEETKELKNRLIQTYQKRSTLFADSEDAEKIVAEFPYLRIVSFEKSYPNRLVLEIREDAEVYAIPTTESETEYYILNADFVVLGVRESSENRSTGAHNVVFKGTHALDVVAEKGKTITGDKMLATLLEFSKKLHDALGGIQRNILTIEVLRPATAESETLFKITTEEGVVLYVRNPANNLNEKANRLIEEYAKLGDNEKTKGALLLYDNDGTIEAYYTIDQIPLQ